MLLRLRHLSPNSFSDEMRLKYPEIPKFDHAGWDSEICSTNTSGGNQMEEKCCKLNKSFRTEQKES